MATQSRDTRHLPACESFNSSGKQTSQHLHAPSHFFFFLLPPPMPIPMPLPVAPAALPAAAAAATFAGARGASLPSPQAARAAMALRKARRKGQKPPGTPSVATRHGRMARCTAAKHETSAGGGGEASQHLQLLEIRLRPCKARVNLPKLQRRICIHPPLDLHHRQVVVKVARRNRPQVELGNEARSVLTLPALGLGLDHL